MPLLMDHYTFNTYTPALNTHLNYQYTSLSSKSSIRLVQLSSRDDISTQVNNQAHPQCEIIQASLDDHPVYETVSYVWGSLTPRLPVLLPGGKCVNVTKNLYTALQRFLPAHGKRRLWVDQLCINQCNLSERSQQVKLMARIFQQARRTNVWLGEESNDMMSAFKHIEFMKTLKKHPRWKEPANDSHLTWLQDAIKSDGNCHYFMQFIKSNQWFMRIWVFQEIVVSKNITMVCGSMHCSWDEMLNAMSLQIIKTENCIGDGFIQLNAMREHRQTYQEGGTLSLSPLLLNVNRQFRCTDPRDKVYALLGFIPQGFNFDIRIDYAAPVSDTYANATRKIIESTHSLNMFYCLVERSNPSVPSWVPDLEAKVTTLPTGVDAENNPQFTAALDFPYRAYKVRNPRHLVVTGRVVDVVQDIIPNSLARLIEIGTEKNLWLELMSDLTWTVQQKKIRSHSLRINPHLRVESVMRTLLLDCAHLDGLLDTKTTRRRSTKTELGWLWGFLLTSDGSGPEQEDYTDLDGLDRIILRSVLRRAWKYRMLLIPIKSFLGMGPRETRRGDLICILHGSSVPCVLRRVNGDQYQIIGQCYVDGIMYGEAVTWKESEADRFTLI